MNKTKQSNQLDADAARAARTLLQDEVRARRDQERAMLGFGIARPELPATKSAQSTLQSVAKTLREHPVGVGIGALAAGVAIARAMQLRA